MSLLDKSKKGDIEAFEKIIESHQKRVFNIILWVLRDKSKACELAQQIFVAAFRSVNSFSSEASLLTWVYSKTAQVCARKNKIFNKNKDTGSIEAFYG